MRLHDTVALAERKVRLDDRLDRGWQPETSRPVLEGANLRYEVSDRVSAVECGGIGTMHELVRAIGLPEAIDGRLRIFKRHLPYHESDHVLSLVYNVLAGGTCLEDLERLRRDEAYLDTLGCRRIPDPTTAGDFLRRFADVGSVNRLQDAIDEVRVQIGGRLPPRRRRLALVDFDGTVAPTEGECKEGMDLSYKGEWGYHPLVVSLANTQEVLYTRNRSGNAVSHTGMPSIADRVIALVRRGGFGRVRLRGDTDFSLTEHFDRWTGAGVEFVFGIDAHPSFVERAMELPEGAWKRLSRPRREKEGTKSRLRPANVKAGIVFERGYRDLFLEREDVAEIDYTPVCSRRVYRMIVVRKTIAVVEGQLRLSDETRYLFYVTNVSARGLSTASVVFEANARCNQENLIEQLKNGVKALRMPSDGLLSNWAYLVIASLAWNLKTWLGLVLRRYREAREIGRMEFRRFVNSLIRVPCQVVRSGRRLVLRLLGYTPWARLLLDGTDVLKHLRWT